MQYGNRSDDMNNTDLNFIDSAKQYAREAIHEAWPTAREVAGQTAGMYEFDAIYIDNEACPIGSVSIMHDPDAGTFALAENTRLAIPSKEETA
jgi:hypothetical protein